MFIKFLTKCSLSRHLVYIGLQLVLYILCVPSYLSSPVHLFYMILIKYVNELHILILSLKIFFVCVFSYHYNYQCHCSLLTRQTVSDRAVPLWCSESTPGGAGGDRRECLSRPSVLQTALFILSPVVLSPASPQPDRSLRRARRDTTTCDIDSYALGSNVQN